jgi:hypothetical protein
MYCRKHHSRQKAHETEVSAGVKVAVKPLDFSNTEQEAYLPLWFS